MKYLDKSSIVSFSNEGTVGNSESVDVDIDDVGADLDRRELDPETSGTFINNLVRDVGTLFRT